MRKIPEYQLRQLLVQGYKQVQITKMFGVTKQAVHYRINYKSKMKEKEVIARKLVASGAGVEVIRSALGHRI